MELELRNWWEGGIEKKKVGVGVEVVCFFRICFLFKKDERKYFFKLIIYLVLDVSVN